MVKKELNDNNIKKISKKDFNKRCDELFSDASAKI